MNHGARCKEQSSFKPGMSNQVEKTICISAYAQRHNHKSQLADCRICEYFFKVDLGKGNCCGNKCSNCTNNCNKSQSICSKHRKYSDNKVYTSSNHCSSMDQC